MSHQFPIKLKNHLEPKLPKSTIGLEIAKKILPYVYQIAMAVPQQTNINQETIFFALYNIAPILMKVTILLIFFSHAGGEKVICIQKSR